LQELKLTAFYLYLNMKLKTDIMGKKEVQWFLVSYSFEDALFLAEVHEIDMSGWTLFECMMLPSLEVIYLAWNSDMKAPEWKEVNGGKLPNHMPALANAILKKKQEGLFAY
jgi:hypothetical protein